MKHIIIGTAGHVDHGKSALIKALTGTDTDRLKEEKTRGISIDLGFAVLQVGENITAGIVDVPGHERFLKNMLAGTGSLDLVMLVIAADEGVMPQTREHLEMLHFYGIQQGLVVINKIDKVDEEWLELVEEEVRSLLEGTFLSGATFCRVSAVTGLGLEELKEHLALLAEKVAVRDKEAPFRLWVDRVFTIKGHGTVVTGSVLSGTARVGDTLLLYPAQEKVRVRGAESHGQKAEEVYAGQRAALNLGGMATEELGRGMFLSQDGYGQVSEAWDALVLLQQPVESGTRIRLHVGTGEIIGRIYSFKNGTEEYMRLLLEKPLAASAGDRGILRLYSPQLLLGGVLLIAPSRKSRRIGEHRMFLGKALLEHKVTCCVQELLADHGGLLTLEEIKEQTGYFHSDKVERGLAELVVNGTIKKLVSFYIDTPALAVLTARCKKELAAFHRQQPKRAGLSREIIKQKLALADKQLDILEEYWKQGAAMVSQEGELALAEHAVAYQAWCQEVFQHCEQQLTTETFYAFDRKELQEKLAISSEIEELVFNLLLSKEILIPLDTVYIYQKSLLATITLLREHFRKEEELTVSQFRTLLNTSRKVAVPLIEYLDRCKYTVRKGEGRYAGPRLQG